MCLACFDEPPRGRVPASFASRVDPIIGQRLLGKKMNGMRKIFGLLMAFMLVGFALPSIAAQPSKIFGLVMAPATVPSSPAALTATFSNTTPTGNSVINTVILTPPAGVSVSGILFPQGGNQVQCPATTVNSSGQTVPVPPGSICVANIPSLMKAACTPVACSWKMTLNATLPNTCGVNTWAGQAFAGNSFNGDVFVFQAAQSSVTTTINSGCVYSINATASGPGTIAPAGITQVGYGGSQTYTMTPDTVSNNGNNAIVDVKVDNVSQGAIASYTFSNVQANHTISATFVAKMLSITSAPTSALALTPFNVVVGETPGGPTPSMASDCGATQTNTSTPTSTTFAVTIPNLGACNITFSLPGYTSATLTLTAYKGTLACGDYDSSLGNTDFTFDPDASKEYVVPGGSGWGLRRGPNRDGSTCNVKVNYTCNLDGATNIAACSWDKLSGQQATFKYVFVWKAVSPDADGWKVFRPLISWGIASPGAPVPYDPNNTGSYNYNWMPGLACVWDMFPALPTLPTTILPSNPFTAPWTDNGNTSGQYPPGGTAWVCVSQQGVTSVGAPSGPVLLQFWNKVIDEADVVIKGPG